MGIGIKYGDCGQRIIKIQLIPYRIDGNAAVSGVGAIGGRDYCAAGYADSIDNRYGIIANIGHIESLRDRIEHECNWIASDGDEISRPEHLCLLKQGNAATTVYGNQCRPRNERNSVWIL